MPGRSWSPLLETWFGETLADPSSVPGRMGWWFSGNDDQDAMLREKFGDLVEQCALGRNYEWLDHPEGRLAMILALDQLPRNLFRGTTRAFEYDAYTAALCLASAHTGIDRKLAPVQRAFLYMPLQHFEDLQAQDAGVTLYEGLARENPDYPFFEKGFLSYAILHRDIIARFGRFPHRNRVLNRKNTTAETGYLAGNAPTFGQS